MPGQANVCRVHFLIEEARRGGISLYHHVKRLADGLAVPRPLVLIAYYNEPP